MAYTVAVTYTAKPGDEAAVLSALKAMIPLTRAEPGCRTYVPNRSFADPLVFLLYEEYADKASFEEHARSEHFERYIRSQV